MRELSYTRPIMLFAGFIFLGCASGTEASSVSGAAESALVANGVDVTLSLSSDWTSGYCASVTLKNGSTAPVSTWSVTIGLNQAVTGQIWSATSSMADSTLTVSPTDFNRAIPVGGTVTFGFCGTATGSNYRPALLLANIVGGQNGSGGGTSVGGSSSTGGATSAGGYQSTGGRSATGGATATGGVTSVIGGASSTGGVPNTGGTSTAGGTATVGGSTSTRTCSADTVGRTRYCKPQTDALSGLVGSATINGITFNATGNQVTVTTAGPLSGAATLTGLSPYNVGDCSGAGVNATSLVSGQPYTGLSMSIRNSGSASVTIGIYVDSLATGGQHVSRKYTFPPIPADGTAHSYNLTWSSPFTQDCQLPSGSSFDQTKIIGIGFGVDSAGNASALNLLFTNIAFTGGGTSSPCADFCSSPTTFTVAGSYSSGNIGAGPLCRQTTSNFSGGSCGNFSSPRTLYVNGAAMTCGSAWSLPAKVNGGYCFHAPAGDYPWAYFGVW